MLRELRPRAALFENVPGLLTSDEGRFFNRVLSDIHESGYDAEWRVVSAFDAGAPHLRKRVWIVAYPQGERWESAKYILDSKRQNWVFEKAKTNILTSIARENISDDGEILIADWPRNDDGIPEGLDRLKCLGNSIVPQIAEYLWGLIKEALW